MDTYLEKINLVIVGFLDVWALGALCMGVSVFFRLVHVKKLPHYLLYELLINIISKAFAYTHMIPTTYELSIETTKLFFAKSKYIPNIDIAVFIENQ